MENHYDYEDIIGFFQCIIEHYLSPIDASETTINNIKVVFENVLENAGNNDLDDDPYEALD